MNIQKIGRFNFALLYSTGVISLFLFVYWLGNYFNFTDKDLWDVIFSFYFWVLFVWNFLFAYYFIWHQNKKHT